jgi:hypothetical protein
MAHLTAPVIVKAVIVINRRRSSQSDDVRSATKSPINGTCKKALYRLFILYCFVVEVVCIDFHSLTHDQLKRGMRAFPPALSNHCHSLRHVETFWTEFQPAGPEAGSHRWMHVINAFANSREVLVGSRSLTEARNRVGPWATFFKRFFCL